MVSHLNFIFLLTVFIFFHPVNANTFETMNYANEDMGDVEYHLALHSPPLSEDGGAYVTTPIHSTTACNITHFPIHDEKTWYQSNGETYADTVLLVDEKDCDIMQQAKIAQQIGVIGLVIISPSESHVITTPIPSSFNLTIPLFSISKIDGVRMQQYINIRYNLLAILWEKTNEPKTSTMIPTLSNGTTEMPTTEIPTTIPTTQIPTEIPTTEVPTTEIPTTQIPTTIPPITTDAPTTTTPSISSTGSTSSSTGISHSSTALPVNDASTCIPSIFILVMIFLYHVY